MTTKNIVLSLAGVVIILIGVFYFAPSRQVDVVKKLNDDTSKQNEFVFDGEGKKVVGPVVLAKGLVILKAKNQSGVNSSFSVNIYKDANGNGSLESGEGYTGNYISVGYEDAEAFNGAIAFKSDGGAYFADIGGGRWQISFVPMEKLLEVASAPTSFSGNGSQVTDKFYLAAGEYRFSVTNKGGGNFIIYMVDEDGNFTSRLVNEIDNFEGDFTVKNVFDGNYIFMIDGGNWTIEVN